MDASSCSLWQCSTCTYANNKRAAVECEMCGAALRMSGAAVSGKRPASPVLQASAAVPSKPSKLSRKVAVAKKPPPQDQHSPMHPSGVVLDIVGTNRDDRGRSCEEHEVNCGEVLAEDVVVRLRKVQILVEGMEETAIACYWVTDGIDRCRVGFLMRHMVQHADKYDGALAQVTRVCSDREGGCTKTERRQYHDYRGS